MKSKGQAIGEALKRRWMTYGDMQALGLSTSPHKRAVEALRHFPGYFLDKRKGSRGLIEWRYVKVKG